MAHSDLTKAGMDKAKARGAKFGSPGNLTKDGQAKGSKRSGEKAMAEANKHYADIISLVVTLRKSGLTLRDIADHLNRSGRTTRRCSKWNPAQVSRVIERGKEGVPSA